MLLVLKRSVINEVFDVLKDIHVLVTAAMGSNAGEKPFPNKLETGTELVYKTYTLKVKEEVIEVEVNDEFLTDYIKLYAKAIPLFAPVIGSAIASVGIMKSHVLEFSGKWTDAPASVEAPPAEPNRVYSDIGVSNEYSELHVLRVFEIKGKVDKFGIQALSSYHANEVIIPRTDFLNFVYGYCEDEHIEAGANAVTCSNGVILTVDKTNEYGIRYTSEGERSIDKIELSPEHVLAVLAKIHALDGNIAEHLEAQMSLYTSKHTRD